MVADRSFAPSVAVVMVGFLDGQSQSGTLTRFSPSVADLTVTLSGGVTPKATYPAERIAYVGFQRSAGDPPPPPNSRRGELKLHLSGGKTFLVDPIDPPEPGAIGFYARPADGQSPFREIFFYAHGINLREINEPLGSMLVKEGRVGQQGLARGLDAQKEQKRTPIGQILVEHKKVDLVAMEQAAVLQKRKGTRIGEVLIEAGLADAHDIEFALAEQRKRGGKRIGQILVEMSLVSEVDLSMTLAKKFQLPFVDLDRCSINLTAIEELSREFIEKHKVLPVESEPKVLTVAMGDPLAVDTIDAIRLHTKKQIREVVATPSQLEKYIPTYLDQLDQRKVANEMDSISKGLAADDVQAVQEAEGPDAGNVKESDNSIIKLANQIIIDAYRRGASDIHIEPNGKERTTMVRFRIDGDCVSYQEIPSTYRLPLVARFKIMALLDIAERRKPQDGKIRFRVGEKQIELRVATIPTVNGNEDVVLRILAASKPLPLEKMGLSERNLAELKKVIGKPYGLVLCVGPTGSGKTTTLHSALGAINTVDMKIWTAEDPVEITQPGLAAGAGPSQDRVHLRASDARIPARRSRRDHGRRDARPRDRGHRRRSVAHRPPGVLHAAHQQRARDHHASPRHGARSVQLRRRAAGVMAQRLARALCRQCREQYVPDKAESEELAQAYGAEEFRKIAESEFAYGMKLWRAVGCSACSQSGYKGRLGLHELLVTDDHLKRAIQKKASVDDIRTAAMKNGMTTLLQDGVRKVLAGLTDMKQVLAVCSR